MKAVAREGSGFFASSCKGVADCHAMGHQFQLELVEYMFYNIKSQDYGESVKR